MKLSNEAQYEHLKEVSTKLKQAREEKSIPIEDIASKTLIRNVFLKALDEQRFEELPEPAYVQGFIRHYANAVGLDGNDVASDFSTIFQLLEVHEDKDLSSKSDIHIPLFVPYILLIIAASFGLFHLLKPKDTNTSNKNVPAIVRKLASSITLPSLTSPINATNNVQVILELKNESQLEVKADGQIVFKGNLAKGQRITWTAKKQLTVRSSNAGVVMVSVNNKQSQPLGKEGEVKEVTFKRE